MKKVGKYKTTKRPISKAGWLKRNRCSWIKKRTEKEGSRKMSTFPTDP
jgi:hypothetical protein